MLSHLKMDQSIRVNGFKVGRRCKVKVYSFIQMARFMKATGRMGKLMDLVEFCTKMAMYIKEIGRTIKLRVSVTTSTKMDLSIEVIGSMIIKMVKVWRNGMMDLSMMATTNWVRRKALESSPLQMGTHL